MIKAKKRAEKHIRVTRKNKKNIYLTNQKKKKKM